MSGRRPVDTPRLLSRRAAIEMAVLTLGVLSSSAMRALAAEGTAAKPQRQVFSAAQRATVSTLADLIIPETDTPGAIQAGVPGFIESMVSEWYTETERNIFLAGISALDTGCLHEYGAIFTACSPQQQAEALGATESAARAYAVARDTAMDSNTPFFTKLRELTVLGYYTSELGAKRELRYNPVPGHFDGDLPWTSESRQWSS